MSESYFEIQKYHTTFVIVILNVLRKVRDPYRDRDQSSFKSVIVINRRRIFMTVIVIKEHRSRSILLCHTGKPILVTYLWNE